MALHGLHILSHRHPQVGGQGNTGGAEQVYILAHPGITHLDREVGGNHHSARDTGLQRGIERVAGLEGREVEPIVELHALGDGPVVLGKGHNLVGQHRTGGKLYRLVDTGVHLHRVIEINTSVSHFGGENMAHKIGAELGIVVRIGHIVEVGTDGDVLNARLVVARYLRSIGVAAEHQLLDVANQVVVILRISGREVEEELRAELVVPSQLTHHVAPPVFKSQTYVLTHRIDGVDSTIYLVLSHVETAVEAALVAELVRQLGVEVIEPVARLKLGVLGGGRLHLCCRHLVDFQYDGDEEKLSIGAAGRDTEGGASFVDRAFEVHFGRDKANGNIALQMLVVAVVLRHVQHRTQPSAETGGEAAFVKGHILDGIGIEGREETAEMRHIVERHAVEQEEVLVGTAATHIHATVALTSALHTRHQLQGLDDVGLAEEHRHRLDFLHRHVHGAHLRRPHVARAFRGDGHLVEGHTLPHLHIELHIAAEGHVVGLRFIPHVGDAQADAVGLEGQRIMAVEVGHGTLAAAGVEHRGADEGLAVALVGHRAADSIAPLSHHTHRQKQ